MCLAFSRPPGGQDGWPCQLTFALCPWPLSRTPAWIFEFASSHSPTCYCGGCL